MPCFVPYYNLLYGPLFRRWLPVFILLLLPCSPLTAQLKENAPPIIAFSYGMPMDTSAIWNLAEEGDKMVIRDKDSAVSLYLQAIRESKAALYPAGMIHALRPVLGLLPHAESERLLNELYFICSRSERMKSVLPVIYNARAKICQLKGDYQQAAAYYMKAIPLARKHLPAFLAVVYNNYGSLLLFLPADSSSGSDQALYYLDEAAKIANKEKDVPTKICVLCNKGKIYRSRKEYGKSLDTSLKALELAEDNHLMQWEYVLLNNIGDLHYITGRPGKALYYLKRAIKMDGTELDPYYRNMSVFTLGEVYFDLGNYDKAEYYFKWSLRVAKKYNIGRDLMGANEKLAALYAEQGKFREAFGHLKNYDRYKDSLRNVDVLENIRKLSVKYRAAEQNKELLKNKLHIARQEQLLRRKNRILFIAIALAVIIIFTLYNRFRQKRKLLRREEQIKEMKALIKGEEKERIRLAQDLHDGIGGMLAAVNMNMNVAKKSGFADKTALDNIMQMIEDTTDEVRKTSHNLMPSALLRKNLKEALQYYCDAVNKDGALCIDLNTYGELDTMNTLYVTLIFRTVQELIQNIIKHAEASHVIVSLEKEGKEVNIMVEDNGKGFDARQQPRGFGLEHLSFRLKALGGTFHIASEAGVGTSVAVHFELKDL